MTTLLDRFIQRLSSPVECEDSLKRNFSIHTNRCKVAPVSNLECEFTLPGNRDEGAVLSQSLHTHTSCQKSFPRATLDCDSKCEDLLTVPEPPIRPGWVIAWRDSEERLRGGHDERAVGVVVNCVWDEQGWQVELPSGDRIPLQAVTSVAKVNARGKAIAAWLVREHGYDGEG